MLAEMTHIQDVLSNLWQHSGDPLVLPDASEQFLCDVTASNLQHFSQVSNNMRLESNEDSFISEAIKVI